jgi:hypothetical protein
VSAGYTPGPWFAGRLIMSDDVEDFGTVSVGQRPVTDKPSPAHYEDTLCDVWQNPNIGNDGQADANLIAAAPDLYEALKEYMECVALATNPAMQQADVLTLAEFSERMTAARDGAEAALAKVETPASPTKEDGE